MIIEALIFSTALLVHGDADWIRKGGYKDRFGSSCCGVTDCHPAKAGEIIRLYNGWLHVESGKMLLDGEIGIYPSTDEKTWWCALSDHLKCVFPGAGG